MRRRHTIDDVIAAAKNFSTRTLWFKSDLGRYKFAKKNNIFEICCAHMPPNTDSAPWTLEGCKTEAARFKTRGEWQKKSKGSYLKAFHKNWIELCAAHMSSDFFRSKEEDWDKDKNLCLKNAIKFLET